MKIALITATKFDYTYDYNNLITLGIGYLAGMINQEIPEVKVFLKERLEDLIEVKPDVVGISSLTENYHIAIDWAKEIKEKLFDFCPETDEKCFYLLPVFDDKKGTCCNSGDCEDDQTNRPQKQREARSQSG